MSLKTNLERIAHLNKNGPISLKELAEKLGTDGHGPLILIFVLPFLQPIPFPGFSSFLGAVIVVVALQLSLKRPLWIPKRFQNRMIELHLFEKVAFASEKVIGFIENVVPWHIQMGAETAGKVTRVLGLAIAFQAVLLSLPLPIPFSNFFPSVSIFFLTLGLMEENWVFTILGAVLWIVAAAFFVTLAIAPLWIKQHWAL